MNGTRRDVMDSAVGSLLALVALVFGFIGWLTGLAGDGRSSIWFLSAGILGAVAVGVVLDEARVVANASRKRAEMALSWLLMLAALAVGAVGFIAGLAVGRPAFEWLWAGIILALVSVAIMADEGRRLRAGPHGVVDEVVGGLLSVLAIALGIVGFLVGIMRTGQANEWLYAGVIAALAATAFMFDGERRATIAAARTTAATGTAEGYRGSSTG